MSKRCSKIADAAAAERYATVLRERGQRRTREREAEDVS